MKATMTASQFAAAATLARLPPEREAVARAVLVDGKSYVEAVAPYGWSRQAAYKCIKTVQEHWSRYRSARAAEVANSPSRSEAPHEAASEQ